MLALLLACQLPIRTIRILKSPRDLLNTFVPEETLGAGFDGHEKGEIEKIFRPDTLREMRSAGLQPLSYRLRTELAVDAWHWNPRGSWSGRGEGYWHSSQAGPIRLSHGYRLPRRGGTGDEANNDGYSRIDDGDPATFWKSNPYLAKSFTHEEDSKHPQQIVLNLGKPRPINQARIAWGAPYARDFAVEYWDGENQLGEAEGGWKPFPHGKVVGGRGGDQTLTLDDKEVEAQFVRIRMTRSSYTSAKPSKDVRDRCGYALRELSVGLFADGRFSDWVEHGKQGHQTWVCVSSTDPWHREADVDSGVEQAGFDLISELAQGQPMLVPVPTLYGTPDEAAGIVRYLRSRHIPIRGVELGEEPDGQFVSPEDYAALYIQMAQAIRRVDKKVPLGGPSFEDIQSDVLEYPHPPQTAWSTRFREALRARGKLGLFQFCSFEWYPYDRIDEPAWRQLQGMESRMREAIVNLDLPRKFPLIISEYGWSAFAAQSEVDLEGALMDADIVGSFLSFGGNTAYLYGYEPSNLAQDQPENGWGDNMLFLGDAERRISAKVARYWGAFMETHHWATPATGRLRLYDARADAPLRAFPLRLPGGSWSVLVLNEDPDQAYPVQIEGMGRRWRVWQFGREQYAWKADGARGKPARSLPPRFFTAEGTATLPPYSITVIRD
ncbi:MAG TPA: discoidin domain-containing protein [Fimbriimonadaceae bacterium]|nr:discoidin domain-containing protein [Fimbriimonadaceae bacterium]